MAEKAKAKIKVRALKLGYFDNRRIREGEEFFIKDMAQKGKWMELVEAEPAIVKEEKKEAKKEEAKADSKKVI